MKEEHPKHLNLKLALSATLLGNTLEWYDYATYGFLVPIFSQIFFIKSDPLLALIPTLFIFVVGSIGRPIGGIFFGFIGDRYGRKIALISSIALMTLPVFIIGLLPTYAQIGIAAPLILALMRFFQGLAAGGEFPGVAVFLVESSQLKTRGFFGSFVYFGVMLGILIGGIDYFLLDLNVSRENLYSWGWRIPFILGALIGCTTFYLRRKLHETPLFEKTKHNSAIVKDPLLKSIKWHKVALLQIIGLELLETVGFNSLITFLMIYLMHFLEIPIKTALLLNLIFLFGFLIFLPIMGKISCRIGCRSQCIFAACSVLLFTLPLFLLLNQNHFFSQCAALICFALLLASYYAPLPTLVCDLLPTPVRFTGLALSYNLTIGFIGGFTPLINLYLIEKYGSTLLPAYFVMAAALISLITLLALKKRRFYLVDPQETIPA